MAFPHQQILKALKGHPEGVSPKYVKKQENKGVDLSNSSRSCDEGGQCHRVSQRIGQIHVDADCPILCDTR